MTLYALESHTPEVDPEAWVAPNAQIIGKVRIAAGASVWFGAVLRGDNEWIEIGPGSNVQDNAVAHTDPGFPLTIGRNCTVGHSAIVHGCTIGDGALIGMGATVLNGARIGAGALVGAGAVVTEAKDIPDRSLVVGMPGKPVRRLDDQGVDALLETAAGYRARIVRFREGLAALDSGSL
ncbi:MAG: gamma carbonic anhydrase family protein [Pseudomonadota bacterium]